MKVSHRLYLASVPAVLGVFAVAALGYWGQYAHTVPELLLVIAAITSVGTLAMAWTNVRYVAQRVERLAGSSGTVPTSITLKSVVSAVAPARAPGTRDELDTIESVVTRLSSAVEQAEQSRVERERTFEQRAADYAHMLSAVAAGAARSLENVRLPLHILLANHFGELNENQEELLGAARLSAERADADIVALQQIADLDLGTVNMRRDRVMPGDVVRAIAPELRAIADRQGVVLELEIEPLVPAIIIDQAAMQHALSTMFGAALGAMHGGTAAVALCRLHQSAKLELRGAAPPDDEVQIALAQRVIGANGGEVEWRAGVLQVIMRSS